MLHNKQLKLANYSSQGRARTRSSALVTEANLRQGQSVLSFVTAWIIRRARNSVLPISRCDGMNPHSVSYVGYFLMSRFSQTDTHTHTHTHKKLSEAEAKSLC